jgi:hypothetical protein
MYVFGKDRNNLKKYRSENHSQNITLLRGDSEKEMSCSAKWRQREGNELLCQVMTAIRKLTALPSGDSEKEMNCSAKWRSEKELNCSAKWRQ